MTSSIYQVFIQNYFARLLELRHTAALINYNLKHSIKKTAEIEGVKFISAYALIVSDWTGPTDNGWTINYHTGISKIIYRNEYESEVERIISTQCCYSFAQSFEALETFLKDCVYMKSQNDKAYRSKISSIIKDHVDRATIPGGDKLFDLIKIAGGVEFKRSSEQNNRNIKFKEFWTVLSEVRHAITHSSAILKVKKIQKTEYHFAVFEYFFGFFDIDQETLQICLDYKELDRLIKALSEFAFQIFKVLSILENTEWNILTK
jgi:hypothetical protein